MSKQGIEKNEASIKSIFIMKSLLSSGHCVVAVSAASVIIFKVIISKTVFFYSVLQQR
jgi:hypothetical protein